MTTTHYKGKKIPLVLIPNNINLPPTLLHKEEGIDFSSYPSLNSILYPDALFFYDIINRNFNSGGKYDLSDLFYSISEIDNNAQAIHSLESTLSDTRLTEAQKTAKQSIKQLFGSLTDNYSMIELLLILSNQFTVSWEREFLVIKAEEFDLSEDTLAFLNNGSFLEKPKNLNRLPIVIENFKKLWIALRTNLSYKDLVNTNLTSYYVELLKKSTLSLKTNSMR